MRSVNFFIKALLILFFAAVGLLHGANYYLRDGGGEIVDILRRHIPESEVQFARAGLYLAPGAIAFRVDALSVKHAGAEISAPRADFWLGTDGIVALLHSPEIVLRRDNEIAAPILGEWAVEARKAILHLHDSANKISLTLQNAFVQAHFKDGRLRANLENDDGDASLQLAADMQFAENGVRGIAEVKTDNWLPDNIPSSWRQTRATVRATFDENGATLSAAGATTMRATATVQWRANGDWDGAAARLTLTAAANDWIPPFANAPPFAAFLHGDLHYENDKWQWRGNVLAAGKDGKLGGKINAHGTRMDILGADINLHIRDAPAAAAWKYISHDDTREWMAESLADGIIHAAHLQASGLPQSPQITLRAAFSDARIRLGEDWPAAHHLRGVIYFDDSGIVVNGKGAIGGAAADAVRARIPFSEDENAAATLHLNVAFNRAPLQTYLTAARAIPPAREKINSATEELKISGNGNLSLTMAIPLAMAENTSFAAILTLRGDATLAAAGLPPLNKVAGDIKIGNESFAADLRGRLTGEPATLRAQNDFVQIFGGIPASAALSVAEIKDIPADGIVQFHLSRNPQATIFLSDLRGVSLGLPQPLTKRAYEFAALHIKTGNGETHLSLALRENVFELQTANGGANVAINIPLNSLPPAAKSLTQIRGEIGGELNADEWLAFGGGGGGKLAISLILADAEIFNMPPQTLTIESPSHSENTVRRIVLNGDAVAGTILFHPGELRAELSRLHLAKFGGGKTDIHNLSLMAAVDDFRLGDVAIGAMTVRGEPGENGWTLNTLHIENGDNALSGGGYYDGVETILTLLFAAPDAPAALSVVGQENAISEGGMTLAGTLSWPGPPSNFSLDGMDGRATLLAEDLRYLKTEQGVISFLAIFSPQSLLQLGFTELGKEGVRIDTMRGEIGIRNGAAEFRDILMNNDDLNISMRGTADLQARTLDLNGRVRPGNRLLNAGSAVGIGAIAAAQPLSLAAGWFLGKIFEKPLSEIGAYNYTITGEWSAPVYAEISTSFTPPAAGNAGQ